MVEERMGDCWSYTKDQFDNLEKHTQWGIEFVEKYTKFVKERSEIETSYAKQIRNLSKKYQPKKNSREEDESKFTFCRAFLTSLNELNDYAGQHEVIAENLTSQIIAELSRYLQELKAERKTSFHDGRKAQQHIESSWKQLESCKRRVTAKQKSSTICSSYVLARQQAQMRHQMASDSKSDYSAYLQKFNQEQNEHYFTVIPNIFQDSQQVVESYKSGFEAPGDVEFEDYGQAMKRTVSETSLSNSKEVKERTGGKSKGKLWPFIKNKNKGSGPEDFSHLPPEQRRKKLQGKIDELNKDIQKEMDQRDALTKMKDVYVKNPQMGDPASVDPRLSEIGQNIEKFQYEAQKFEGWLAEVEERMPSKSDSNRRSGLYETQNNSTQLLSNNCAQDRESPDGSYTEEQNSETQVKATVNPTINPPVNPPVNPTVNPALPTSSTPEFDDEFDDDETLPTIGTCKALYPFEGHNEGTIAVAEGELLYVIEEDKGDGWTRVRRNEDEEGYVPTSYVEVFLETNAKVLGCSGPVPQARLTFSCSELDGEPGRRSWL
ncbi:hypothetical protein KUCAC02_008643 [Chaenocephalus aceratus]|uniref:Uncharacterized protein n=1 Tax=Chaenocephalus aceratus TaxID=36190 RepID=A0ACB9WR50_CHAAC|nr:hypothetical protein KUCAC02_008643 [Chaenocephalus aceratus]